VLREELPDSTNWLYVEWDEQGECLLQASFFMTVEGIRKVYEQRKSLASLDVDRVALYRLDCGQVILTYSEEV
jgi:hypothetical protein